MGQHRCQIGIIAIISHYSLIAKMASLQEESPKIFAIFEFPASLG